MNAPQLLSPRAVPLGGIRALPVRRTLPQRGQTLIGAWCFIDHFGPTPITPEQGMSVPRHPHIGLQTVSWLFCGAIDHIDSAGNSLRVRPGHLALMTAGQGISHSEFASDECEVLNGVQLWIALPDNSRNTQHRLEHYQPPILTGPGWAARVAIGELLGARSPVTTHTPTVMAEIVLQPNTTLHLDTQSGISQDFEYGILVDHGTVSVNAHPFAASQLAFLAVGSKAITLHTGAQSARVMLLGGTPLDEQIVMWWNFIARSHEEIVAAHASYTAEIQDPFDPYNGVQFGPFPAGTPAALPAPSLPVARLLPRS